MLIFIVKEHILILLFLILDYVKHLPCRNCIAVFAFNLLHVDTILIPAAFKFLHDC